MNIAIIGGGSIGLLLGGYLSKCNVNVTIYTRSVEQAETIQKKGVTIFTEEEEERYIVRATPLRDTELSCHDFIFIAVKQYHLKQIIPLLMKVDKLNNVIFLQNGMGHLKALNQLKQRAKNVLVGIVEHGAMKLSHHKVRYTGVGELKLGYFKTEGDEESELFEKLAKSGFRTGVYQDWYELMEKKLVVNALINPLTTIYKVENGKLLTIPYYASVMQRLFIEISKVIPVTLEDWKNIHVVCAKTKQNRSSMLRDIECNRPTEIDSILGYVLELAKQKKQLLPITELLYDSIKGMEFTNRGERND